MANAFNPQRPGDSALNAVMAGAMGTGPRKIITFDVPPDGQFADGDGVNGYEDLVKAHKSGAATIEQLSGEGKITVANSADAAFFMIQKDLNTLRTDGTYKTEFELTVDALSPITAICPLDITSIILTAGRPGDFPERFLSICLIDSLKKVEFFFKNPAGTFVLLASFSSAWSIGTKFKLSIEKTATQYIFTSTGNSSSVLITSVKSFPSHFPSFGDIIDLDQGGIMRFDNITSR